MSWAPGSSAGNSTNARVRLDVAASHDEDGVRCCAKMGEGRLGHFR